MSSPFTPVPPHFPPCFAPVSQCFPHVFPISAFFLVFSAAPLPGGVALALANVEACTPLIRYAIAHFFETVDKFTEQSWYVRLSHQGHAIDVSYRFQSAAAGGPCAGPMCPAKAVLEEQRVALVLDDGTCRMLELTHGAFGVSADAEARTVTLTTGLPLSDTAQVSIAPRPTWTCSLNGAEDCVPAQ